MELSNLITESRINNLETKINNYPISIQREKELMILELIQDYYKDYRNEGPEFTEALDMVYDEINSDPDYGFGNKDLALFILRYFG